LETFSLAGSVIRNTRVTINMPMLPRDPASGFSEGISLLHGVHGYPIKIGRGGFGISHIDAERPGDLDEAIHAVPSLPIEETITAPYGANSRDIFSDGFVAPLFRRPCTDALRGGG